MSSIYYSFHYKNILNFLNYCRFLFPTYLHSLNILHYLSIWDLKLYDIFFLIKKNNILFVSYILKFHNYFLFNSLIEICGVDWPQRTFRYELIYIFFSFFYNFRIFLKLRFYEWESISSLGQLYKSCLWLEREMWDMLGIFFISHPDLRRILTDYGFKYFPLRKDFPLSGFTEIRYDDFLKSLIYEPVEFAQEFRNFEFKNPWYFL